MADEDSKLVYSTAHPIPRKKPRERKAQNPGTPPALQKVRVMLERKGRGGKSVTIIEGIIMAPAERGKLLKVLKSRLGTGGTLRNDILEIQGDHRDAVIGELEQMGYRPKRSGG